MAKPLLSKTQNLCLIIQAILFTLLGIIMVTEILKQRRLDRYDEVAIDSKIVEQAVANYNFTNIELAKIIYKDNCILEDLEDKEKLFLVLNTFDLAEEKRITLDEINTKSEQILGKKLDNISGLFEEDIIKDNYDLTFHNNLITIKLKLKEEANVLTKVIEAKENTESLIIYVKMALKRKEITDNNIENILYYKNINSKSYIEKFNEDIEDKINWDKYDTYKYTFQKNNDNFILKTVEKESEE